MGYVPGSAMTIPNPSRNVRRSRTVIGRAAGTVSSRSLSTPRSTRRPASSGSHRSTGSSRQIWPSSTSWSAATATTGFVRDEIRNIVPSLIGVGASSAWCPSTTVRCSSPDRTTATSPGTAPRATCRARRDLNRSHAEPGAVLNPAFPAGGRSARRDAGAFRAPTADAPLGATSRFAAVPCGVGGCIRTCVLPTGGRPSRSKGSFRFDRVPPADGHRRGPPEPPGARQLAASP